MNKRDAIDPHDPIIDVSAPATQIRSGDRRLIVFMLLLVLLSLCVKFSFWFRFPINQDEFLYLSNVHLHARGDLALAFQTIYVHFFSWLPAISDNEAIQVVAARIVMSGFFIGTCVCLFLLGRYLFGSLGALFSVLCYISLLYTQYHGASFRSDTPAAFFSMVAVCLLVVREKSPIASVLAGVSMALACLFTLKAGIYLALLAPLWLVKLWSASEVVRGLRHMILFMIAFASSFALVYGLQRMLLCDARVATNSTFLSYASSTFLTFREFFPSLRFFVLTLRTDLLIWSLVLMGLLLCVPDLSKRGGPARDSAYVVAMATPLLSLLVYRNGYPYFYAFFMPPVTLLCGYAVSRFLSTLAGRNQRLLPAATALLGILVIQNCLVHHPGFSRRTAYLIDAQRKLLREIHNMFPTPVPYIDGCRMVSSFPNAGPILSSVDMKDYLRAGLPAVRELLSRERPIFLLANVPHLNLRCDEPPPSADGYAFLPEDWAALKANFVHHWGPVWILGRHLDLGSCDTIVSFEVPVAGKYAIETDAAVLLDGNPHRGDIVWLDRGTHTLQATMAGTAVTLRWSEHTFRPAWEPATMDLFLGPFL